jgi:hypothetical protein
MTTNCKHHQRFETGENVQCVVKGLVHLSECGGCKLFESRPREEIGTKIAKVIQRVTKTKPCGKCKELKEQMDSMSLDEIQQQKTMIAANMVANAQDSDSVAIKIITNAMPWLSQFAAEKLIGLVAKQTPEDPP